MRSSRWDASTPAERAALEAALQLLAPHFPGEVVRLYVPKISAEQRQRQRETIACGLGQGLPATEIARLAGCSASWVRRVARQPLARRQRFKVA
jgi:DNA invertase Pin-like site-specific DNA recombinase